MIRSTYWHFEIEVRDGDKWRPGVCMGAALSLSEALREGFKEGTYYLGIGHEVRLFFQEICGTCKGMGSVAIKHSRRCLRRPCPDCKRRFVVNQLGPIPLKTGPSVTVVEAARAAS